MHKNHGLFIPSSIDDGSHTLSVDLETLVRYLYLVIFGYNECLQCHTQRQSVNAVQQHMMAKGHCRIDLDDKESEFRDFYEDELETAGEEPAPLGTHNNTHLLSSGKVISHRSTLFPRIRRPRDPDENLEAIRADEAERYEEFKRVKREELAARGELPTLNRLDRRYLAGHRGNMLMRSLLCIPYLERLELERLTLKEKRSRLLRQFREQWHSEAVRARMDSKSQVSQTGDRASF